MDIASTCSLTRTFSNDNSTSAIEAISMGTDPGVGANFLRKELSTFSKSISSRGVRNVSLSLEPSGVRASLPEMDAFTERDVATMLADLLAEFPAKK